MYIYYNINKLLIYIHSHFYAGYLNCTYIDHTFHNERLQGLFYQGLYGPILVHQFLYQTIAQISFVKLTKVLKIAFWLHLMNAVKSVQLKFEQFTNLPLGSPKPKVIQKAQCKYRKLHTYCLTRRCNTSTQWSKHISLLLTDVTGCRQGLRGFRKVVCVYHPESPHMRSLLQDFFSLCTYGDSLDWCKILVPLPLEESQTKHACSSGGSSRPTSPLTSSLLGGFCLAQHSTHVIWREEHRTGFVTPPT